jgi:hypothetical protein
MVDFGGDIPTGTFIDLLCALSNMQICSCRGDIHIKYSLLPSIEMIQEKNISLSLPTLLSMVPELRDSYSFFDDEHQMINKLNIDMGTNNAKTYYNFYIGDGLHRPNRDEIKKAFNTDDVTEQQGSYIVKVPADSISKIMPTVYQDTEGELWYIESPISGMVLPELCLHFLIISALCNIMRYSPHEWSNILSNHDSSEFSLLIRKYLRLFEIKFPMLVTEQISNFKPIIKSDLLK